MPGKQATRCHPVSMMIVFVIGLELATGECAGADQAAPGI